MSRLTRFLLLVPKTLLNAEIEPIVDAAFKRAEFLFARLERRLPFLRRQTLECLLNVELCESASGVRTERERFIPIRLETIVERLVADVSDDAPPDVSPESPGFLNSAKTPESPGFLNSAKTPESPDFLGSPDSSDAERVRLRTSERARRRRFAEKLAARFRTEFSFRTDALCADFAPFDPDSDALFERAFSPDERRERRDRFVAELKRFLADCNFVELPRDELARCLRLSRPDSLPVVARYDDFAEYRVFARGFSTVSTVFPRWKGGGRFVELTETKLRRVCVLARVAPNKRRRPFEPTSADGPRDSSSDSSSAAPPSSESDSFAERDVVVKLFKNVSLDDLKLLAPRVEIAFRPLDGIKTGGFLLGAFATAFAKLLFASALAFANVCAFLVGVATAIVKGAFSVLNRRTVCLQKYSNALYFKALASNRAAISLIASAAVEQEIKETIIGYFAAASLGRPATEREIDAVAERWIRDRFGLAVDFESPDALRKLREKRLVDVESAPTSEPTSEPAFRAVSLDEALRRLDADWNSLLESI